jgi:hypothetical protein
MITLVAAGLTVEEYTKGVPATGDFHRDAAGWR